ncbi:MAG: ATP-grasp domain-containing protein [Patescibacteria group bacterium]
MHSQPVKNIKPRGNIVIWLKNSQKETFAPSYHKSDSYNELARALAAQHNLFFAFDAGSYKGNDIFEPVSDYISGAIMPSTKQITADVIYNLGNIPDEDVKTLRAGITNTPAFKNFCASKWDTYQYLQEFSPQTIPVATEKEFVSATERIKTNTIVFKPNTGTNGIGVRIFEKDNMPFDEEIKSDIRKGAILQEFVDTKNGIAHVCDSYHDLRIVTINETIALTHVRTPETGSRIASYQQGATIRELALSMLPKEIISFYSEVHKKIIARFPKSMYSMDIGMGPNGPRLFELNGHTAFPWPDFECKTFFIENLVAHIESFLRPQYK